MSDLNLTAAVFANSEQLILVRLEDDDADRAVADAAARGYIYAGVYAVTAGVPSVEIAEGQAAAMWRAGVVFAGMLGPVLKQQQLEERA